jgi:CHAT domain-containing protein
LGQVIALNRGGHPGQALVQARDAAARLESAGLRAAAALARTEFIYAARWADLYRECRETTGILLGSLGSRYPWIEGSARLNYSSCLLRMGDDGQARAEIEIAGARLAGARLWPVALRAAQFAAGADSQTGNFGAVWATAVQGLHSYWVNPASDYRAEGFCDALRVAALGMEWRESAVIFYRAAIRFSHAAGNPEMEAANRSHLAELLQQMGDYPSERRELDEMNRLVDSLGQSPDVSNLRWETELQGIQADMATRAGRDPLPELERLAADPAGGGAVQRTSLAQTQGLAFQARGDSAHAAAAFARAIGIAEQRAASLGSWTLRIPVLESAGPSYGNLTLIQLMQQHDPASALATWRRFRPGAEDGRRSIAMAPLPEGIAIWTVDDGHIAVRWLNAPVDGLRRAGEQLVRLCASPSSPESEIRRVGNRLYTALLRPELQRLGPGVILLTTRSWLDEIPFAALTDDQGEFLGRRFHFVQAYGPPRRTPAGDVTSGAAALVVTAPVAIAPGQPPLPALPAAEREAAEVAARFPHAIVSREAGIEWLAENAPRAEVFHFSGHGWANGGSGALILSPGPDHEPRFVTSANLARQDWSRCRLAVLSACLTATGETSGAVNNRSLVQAFLSAGARRVVAARWSIDSEATRVLMDAFYARLASGDSVPKALNGAEADVAASRGWGHPYYWAAFDLFGAA